MGSINTAANGGANDMSQPPPTPENEKAYPAELQALLQKANAGDPSVLPQLKKAFDDHPELVVAFGDLVAHAREALLSLVAGKCLTAREAIARQADDLRARLKGAAPSELEALLVDRIAVSWIEVYNTDIDLAQHLLRQPGAAPATRAAERRLDRAHARFLAAARALAMTTKLLRPAVSPLDLLKKEVGETGTPASGAGRRSSANPAEGVGVVN
jgi:hypothetical protein